METINVPSKQNPLIEDLNKKSLVELKKLFESKKEKNSHHKNVSFNKHLIYYEFAIISFPPLLYNLPTREIQEEVLLENIERFEGYIDYKIEALNLRIGNEEELNKQYFLKGKFTDEKQFYIFYIIK